jgi:hypothetical protein
MKVKVLLMSVATACLWGVAYADLMPWQDYTESDAVWSVTTVRVKPNMSDAYLEGLKKTWVHTNEIAKKLGQVEEYHIYRSDLPGSGNFNLLLVIKYKNSEAMAPNKARFEAFMKELGSEGFKQVQDTAQRDYPAMRDVTGEYALREITINK